MDVCSPIARATRERLCARFGTAEVAPWWQRLPSTLERLATRWTLVVGDPVGRGNTSLVVRCRLADGRRAILKLTPSPQLAVAEAHALNAWAGSRRVPAVWGHDPAGALLLDAIETETPLADQPTPASTGDIGALIADLHRADLPPAPGVIEPLSARVAFMFAHGAKRHDADPVARAAVPRARIERGHDLARTLATDPFPAVLVHGDLHAANVLDGGPGRGLVAIDPRPCIGDGAFDAIDWVFYRAPNPADWPARADQLATALDTTHDRIWQWCVATAPLLAAGKAARGATAEEIEALLALAT